MAIVCRLVIRPTEECLLIYRSNQVDNHLWDGQMYHLYDADVIGDSFDAIALVSSIRAFFWMFKTALDGPETDTILAAVLSRREFLRGKLVV